MSTRQAVPTQAPTQAPIQAPTQAPAPAAGDTDPAQRVHHHAKIDGSGSAPGGMRRTLCGLQIRPRPEAAHMPCCPMCAAEMEALGRRCSHGPA